MHLKDKYKINFAEKNEFERTYSWRYDNNIGLVEMSMYKLLWKLKIVAYYKTVRR